MYGRAPLPKDPRREAYIRMVTWVTIATLSWLALIGLVKYGPSAIDATQTVLGLK